MKGIGRKDREEVTSDKPAPLPGDAFVLAMCRRMVIALEVTLKDLDLIISRYETDPQWEEAVQMQIVKVCASVRDSTKELSSLMDIVTTDRR